MAELKDRIIGILVDYARHRGLAVPDGGIDLDRNLASYGIDSLDQVAIISEIEQELELRFADDDLFRVQTLRELIDVAESARAAA